MQYESSGQLTVRPLCAVFVDDIQASGRSNPYIEVEIGNKRMTSSVATSQGSNPAWVDRIDYKVNHEASFELFAYDSEFRNRGDYNGKATVHLARFKIERNSVEWVDIAKDGVRTGKVKLALEFIPDNTAVSLVSRSKSSRTSSQAPPKTEV